MKYFVRRRTYASILLVAAIAVILLADTVLRVNLFRHQVVSGWIFLAVMILLALYNVRKKFPVPPLISSRKWLQFHLYAGIFTVVPYLLHTGVKIPTGILETVMAILYAAVVITGLFGIFISRVFPRRMTARGGEVVFERLPEHRYRIQSDVEDLVEASVEETQSLTIINFYTEHLHSYFERPRHYFWHLFEFAGPMNRLLRNIEEQYRYLDEKERAILEKISGYVRRKDTLDYHHALQLTLKGWLFVHIPLTYGMMVLIIIHVWLVHAFAGRAL